MRLNVWFFSGYEAACRGTKVLFRSAKYIKQDQLSQVTMRVVTVTVQKKRFLNTT